MAQGLNNCNTTRKTAPTVNANAMAALKIKAVRERLQPTHKATPPVRLAGLYGHNPRQNKLLSALPTADFEHLLQQLEFVAMPLGMTICEADMQMAYVYFPTSSIVSLLYETRDGASAETAVIGNEGLVGVTSFMGGGASQNRTIVKSAGYGFRMRASRLNEEFSRGGALQMLLLRYTQALITQMSQTAVCNRHHSVVQQLCRWLLLSLDRLPSNELSMTQGLIASMLGVRRESVAEAAGKLQDEGLIHYSRGHITVIDRPGLEERVCECYATVKKEYVRLLPEKLAM